MTISNNFDTDNNFWETNPQLKLAGPFKELYTNDKSRLKKESSTLMWTIVLIWDRNSKFYNQPEEGKDGKINLLFNDYFGDSTYYTLNKVLVDKLRDFYINLCTSTAEKTLRGVETKLKERDTFLKETEYTLGEKGDKGWQWGTVDTLDKMMANTKKLYETYEQAMKIVSQEADKGTALGGSQESLADRDEI
jgi:hypothetical protein